MDSQLTGNYTQLQYKITPIERANVLWEAVRFYGWLQVQESN